MKSFLSLVLVLVLASAAWAATPATTKKPPSAPGAKPPAAAPATTSAPAGGASAPARPPRRAASSGRLDGIAAVVNDDVVLDSDVEEQLYLFLMRAQAQQPDSATVDTLRRQVLDQLIDEKLVVAEAKRQGVTVPDADVNHEVDQAIQQAKDRLGTPEAFKKQLASENLTEEKLRDKYRDEVRRQMLGQRLVQRQFPRHNVTQADAEAYFKAHPDKFPKAPAEVHVSVIQIPVEAESSEVAKARVKIETVRKRIVGGEKFAKVAQEVSDDTESAKAGGDLGFFVPGQLEPEFEKAAFSQKIGELGQPVRSSFGWHIIEVLDRDTLKTPAGRDSLDDQGKVVIECHARHILVKVPLGDADVERARTVADRVHDDAVKGADFANLARRFSRYSGPAGPDGDLGFVSLGTLSPNIRAGLDSLAPGQVSEVLTNQRGFNIFKVAERKPERAYTLSEVKDELPNAVSNLEFRDKYDTWVKGLRAKARIQYR